MKARLRTLALISLATLAFAACGAGARARSGVIIEPLDKATAPAGVIAAPTTPSSPTPEPTPTSERVIASPTVAHPTVAPATVAPATVAAPTATAVPPPAGDASLRPSSGRWIEVDVTRFTVRLMDNNTVVQTIAPVGVGVEINTGNYQSTQTGLFRVYNKIPGLAYDAPYKTYISDWVGFDPAKDNGFHSFLKDKDGNVVDPTTGRISNGCIRTGAAQAITAFAEIGMPVWVHL
ncbi:MAG: L,D-transpeptidase [Dehalococcoidia bacterium]|nr:L,D-transpeptidase [Dehalococcoidia bacterium]